MIFYALFETESLGGILLVANEGHLLGIYFADASHAPAIEKDWRLEPSHPVLAEARKQIGEYLAGERTEFTVPLEHQGTAFQEKVWRHIARIPFGKTITYTDLARRAGAPAATRAAGSATGRNPLSIMIPCHRVVGKNGGLGGYAGTLERKVRLLDLEKQAERLQFADR